MPERQRLQEKSAGAGGALNLARSACAGPWAAEDSQRRRSLARRSCCAPAKTPRLRLAGSLGAVSISLIEKTQSHAHAPTGLCTHTRVHVEVRTCSCTCPHTRAHSGTGFGTRDRIAQGSKHTDTLTLIHLLTRRTSPLSSHQQFNK